nr:DUF2911 domain-containing protein [Pseudarcicella sp.]
MKNYFFILILLFVSSFSFSQTLKIPAPSPLQTIKQDFALSFVEVNYSRPALKGRVAFGDLVPFGKLWRTGANAATKITFGEDVNIAGKPIKAGSYAIYVVPTAEEWEVIFNKGVANMGTSGYKKEEDALSVSVKTNKMADKIESFMITFDNVLSDKMNLVMGWENTIVEVPISTNVDKKIMKDIDNAMNVDAKPYFESARYYFENDKDLNKALVWINKATELKPKAFWMFLMKARIQFKMGDKAGAIATSK